MRTLNDTDSNTGPERRTALIALELRRYRIDVAALSETKWKGEGQLTEVGAGYTFFWSGKDESDRQEAGVGFAVKTALLTKLGSSPRGINERIMTMRLTLSKGNYVTLVSVYAPTMTHDDVSKERFYEELRNVLAAVHKSDKLVILGDLNARVGNNYEAWNGVLGKHGIGNMNSNGLLLLSLCQEMNLTISNTIFQQRDMYKGTWKHPRSCIWHMLDYIIVRQRDRNDVCITKTMRGAECWTDHRMVRSIMNIRLSHAVRPQGTKIPRRLNYESAKQPDKQVIFQNEVKNALMDVELDSMNVTQHWQFLQNVIYTSAKSTFGIKKRHHQDWFDENDDLIAAILAEKRAAHNACLHDPSSQSLRQKYTTLLRSMRDAW